jgi:hypothetical protein
VSQERIPTVLYVRCKATSESGGRRIFSSLESCRKGFDVVGDGWVGAATDTCSISLIFVLSDGWPVNVQGLPVIGVCKKVLGDFTI